MDTLLNIFSNNILLIEIFSKKNDICSEIHFRNMLILWAWIDKIRLKDLIPTDLKK